MAALEVLALNTSIPQIQAPQSGDTYTFPRAIELPLGTANGVLYLNGSKVVTSGSALTFDGTTFGVTTGINVGSGTTQSYLAGKVLQFYNTGSGGDGEIKAADDASSVVAIGVNKTDIKFYSSGSEQMRLTSTGLGIGTSSPARKLEVNVTTGPNLRLTTTGSNSAIEFIPSVSSGLYNWVVGAQYNVSNGFEITPSTAVNGTTFSTPALVVLPSGNVGIGTSSPAYKLDVLADASTGANNSATGAGTRFRNIYTRSRANSAGISGGLYAGQLFHVSGGAEFEIYNADNSPLVFGTNATERVRIPAAGGMVVGTAALATTATDGFMYVPTCAGTPTGTPTTQTGTAPIVVDTTNNKLYFYSGGQWRDAGP